LLTMIGIEHWGTITVAGIYSIIVAVRWT